MSDEHEPSARTSAFAAAVDLAIEESESDKPRWRAGFSRSDVEERARDEYGADVSTATVHRALKDAAALGWVEDNRQGWADGFRAQKYATAPTDEIGTDAD